jgi:hypothetical protein
VHDETSLKGLAYDNFFYCMSFNLACAKNALQKSDPAQQAQER